MFWEPYGKQPKPTDKKWDGYNLLENTQGIKRLCEMLGIKYNPTKEKKQ